MPANSRGCGCGPQRLRFDEPPIQVANYATDVFVKPLFNLVGDQVFSVFRAEDDMVGQF